MITDLLVVNEMDTGLLVGVRTGVGALVLVGRGVWVGAGRRVGVAGGRVGAPGGRVGVSTTVGVFVANASNVGVMVGVVGAVTGVMVGGSVGCSIAVGEGVALGTPGIMTTTEGVDVPGNVLTSARKLKYPAKEPTQRSIPTSRPPRMTANDQSLPVDGCAVGMGTT